MTPPEPQTSATDGLVVYGTSWCPDVKRTRAVLDALDQPYIYLDIDTDATARRAVRTLQRGHKRIPTVVWPDGRWLAEPSGDQLLEALTS